MNKRIKKWRVKASKLLPKSLRKKRSTRKTAKEERVGMWQRSVRGAEVVVSRLRAPRLSLKEQSLFAKRLSFLINAGVPIVEALHVLRLQVSGSGQLVLDQVVKDVTGGQSLSRSLAKFPGVFGEFAIHIIRIGESSGTLSLNLNHLADELKKRQALKRKIVGAFIYPALITVATLGITVFLMVYLFPKIVPVFVSLHAVLPLPTRIVMAVSSLLIHWGFWIFLALIVCIIAAVYVVKHNEAVQIFVERSYLRIPLIGNMLRSYNLANSSRTLGILLRSGVQFAEALSVTSDTTKNRLYRRAYEDLRGVVVRGDKISTYLARRKSLFPDMMTHMIIVGEKSGTLSDTLVYLSEMYDAEVDDFTRNLSTLIEPMLMIVMGVVVGFIAISIITPIYGITQNLHV